MLEGSLPGPGVHVREGGYYGDQTGASVCADRPALLWDHAGATDLQRCGELSPRSDVEFTTFPTEETGFWDLARVDGTRGHGEGPLEGRGELGHPSIWPVLGTRRPRGLEDLDFRSHAPARHGRGSWGPRLTRVGPWLCQCRGGCTGSSLPQLLGIPAARETARGLGVPSPGSVLDGCVVRFGLAGPQAAGV